MPPPPPLLEFKISRYAIAAPGSWWRKSSDWFWATFPSPTLEMLPPSLIGNRRVHLPIEIVCFLPESCPFVAKLCCTRRLIEQKFRSADYAKKHNPINQIIFLNYWLWLGIYEL